MPSFKIISIFWHELQSTFSVQAIMSLLFQEGEGHNMQAKFPTKWFIADQSFSKQQCTKQKCTYSTPSPPTSPALSSVAHVIPDD